MDGRGTEGGVSGEGLSEPGVEDQYLVRQWTTQNGLSQNTVTCLEQTADGYLWVGTRYGLARHDGQRLTVFLEELDDVATDAVDVRQLVADAEGTLWILTRQGLFCHRRGRFERVASALPSGGEPMRIETIAPRRAGGIWAGGSSGVGRIDRAGAGWVWDRTRGFTGESVSGLWEDRRGRLWVQGVVGLGREWVRFDPGTGEVRALREVLGGRWPKADPKHPYAWEAILEARDGRFYAVSPSEFVCVDEEREVLRLPAGGWAGASVRGLVEDGDGTIWVMTEGVASLHRFEGSGFTPMQRVGSEPIPSDLRALLVDREGNVWLGTGNAGIYRLQRRPLVARRPIGRAGKEEVFSVAVRREGGAWLGTLNGLMRVASGEATVFNERGESEGPRCKPVFEDRGGNVWVGVLGGGLARLEDGYVKRFMLPSPRGKPDWQVRCLFEDASGGLWVGTDEGLLRWREGAPRWVGKAEGLSSEVVLGITETPDGTLWVGTDGGGLNRLREGRWRVLRKADGLLHDRVWPLAVEPDGAVWLGTPLGLNRVRGQRIDAVTAREGLSEDLAYSLIDDGRGWYWSHGNHGLSRMRREQLNAVADGRESHVFCITYDESDGMESAEGNGDEQPSAARLADGELWFPTTRGVVVVDPTRLKDPGTRPLTVVERMVAGGRELLGPAGPRAAEGPGAEGGSVELRVPPECRGLLEFHYTSPSFVDAERVRFRYRLVGLEDDWHDAGGRRAAYYTGLGPGVYRFEVLAGSRYGVWSDRPSVVALVVEPRFRETGWFGLLVGLGVAGLGAGLHRRRIRYRRRIEELDRRQVLETERSRIARDLHDELGAGLAAVAMKAEFAHGLAREGREIGPILDQVGRSARDLVGRLREAVWALNPACDSLENLVTFLAEWVEDVVEHAQLSCRIEVPPELPRWPMSAEVRHGLVLAVKEAVTNALRHARARELRFAMRIEDHTVVIEVQDDGVGFEETSLGSGPPAAGARGGSGLANLRHRLESLGGHCVVASCPGRGTTVTLRLRVHPPLP